jgi:hypothetical protein
LIAFLAEVTVVKFFSEPEVLFQALAASLMNVEILIFVVPGSAIFLFVIALVLD